MSKVVISPLDNERRADLYTIEVLPLRGQYPELPFLQPGNIYQDGDNNQYLISRSVQRAIKGRRHIEGMGTPTSWAWFYEATRI